jgi:DDE superfamily endonuclease
MPALLSEYAWDWESALAALQRFIVAQLGDPEAIVVLDETAELKKGTATAGVARQHAGITEAGGELPDGGVRHPRHRPRPRTVRFSGSTYPKPGASARRGGRTRTCRSRRQLPDQLAVPPAGLEPATQGLEVLCSIR